MKILIVDDEEDVRRIARLSLVKVGGFEVVEAANGRDALQRAVEQRPDAILLDVMMPEMDGPMTLRALRENPLTAGIDVIFVTARALRSELRELEEMGVRGVLTKPFNAMELSDDVRRVLGRPA